ADKPLISMIAPLFHTDEKNGIRRATDTCICVSRVESWGPKSGWAPWFVWGEKSSARNTRNRFLSGQFVFTLGIWADEVRQDPDHYYWGEEFALSVRSFTHGYDFFVPDSIVAWHMLHLDGPPRRHWEHGDAVVQAKNKVAIDRLAKLVYSDAPADQKALGRYGLGTKRTLAEFERFAGMDLHRKCAHPDVFAGRCPDPITIKSDDDWDQCVPCATYQAMVSA
ncbi:MAG: GlcNAc-transferase family protein, partial [Pseudomonadota bacterium]